ncbi:MAG TPA: DUF819 family protein, partial [Gammaproteobacteria bacterium]|nr:DUF819 family protein [Gammaproteobacteria bacterium]
MGEAGPLVTNDAVVLGLLALILGGVFWTQQSRHPFFQRFYTYVPGLLLCYFLPSLLNTFGIIDGSQSRLYYVASRFLLPACLVLLTLSIDLPAVARLGRKAVIMFFTGTAGIIIGGPLALLLVGTVSPATVGGEGPDAVWRGMTTIAGSWIGGGANQAAMKEVFEVGDNLFGQMIAVDVLCASVWMAVLLFLAGRAQKIDARTGADTSAIEDLKRRIEAYHARHARIPRLADLMFLAAVGFGCTALAHAGADFLAPWFSANTPQLERFSLTSGFFWLVVIATT